MIIREREVILFINDVLVFNILGLLCLSGESVVFFSLLNPLLDVRPLVKQLLEKCFPIIWPLEFIKLLDNNRIIVLVFIGIK